MSKQYIAQKTRHNRYYLGTLGWRKHKLESRLPGEISTLDTTLMAESKEKLKNLLMKVKKESEKVGLKQHSEN